MEGQEKLIELINKYNLDTFPKSIILCGDYGCGKHSLSKYIAKKLNLDIFDLTDNISLERIEEIYLKALPSIYLIDMSNITEKQQNILLKFIEEPLKNSYIILLCENKNTLLDTIKNRCIIFEFEKYKKDYLKNFIKENTYKDLVLNICTTPGQIINYSNTNLTELEILCNKIIDKLHLASLHNTLTISDKINYKDEYDKYDLKLFYKMLIYCIFEKYKSNPSDLLFDLYQKTIDYNKKLNNKMLNKQYLFENYLVNIWINSRR